MKFIIIIICCLLSINLIAIDPVASAYAKEHTLSMIKPDAVAANHIGDIIARFEKSGLRITAIKKLKLSKEEAQAFYAVHADRPFFDELGDFMSSGPVVVMVLEGPNAI